MDHPEKLATYIGYIRRRQTKEKHNTKCGEHHYAQTSKHYPTFPIYQPSLLPSLFPYSSSFPPAFPTMNPSLPLSTPLTIPLQLSLPLTFPSRFPYSSPFPPVLPTLSCSPPAFPTFNMKFLVLTTSCTCNTCSVLIIPEFILGALPKLDKPMKFKPVKKQKDGWDREHALFGQNDYIGKIFSLKICLFS
jgi:hypothetical protein